MDNLLTIGLKSKIITPQDDVMECLETALQHEQLKEKDIIVITSKVVAIAQGRVQKIESEEEYKSLVRQEADQVIGDEEVLLTTKNNIFIPWAGIDKSNTPEGTVVLWPEKPYETAYQILKTLKIHYNLEHVGVVITDSALIPLRKGTIGIAIGYAGFKGTEDYREKKDLFGKKIKWTQSSQADMIATAAHLVMGESTEAMPFAIARGAKVEFTNEEPDPQESVMNKEECIFSPLYND